MTFVSSQQEARLEAGEFKAELESLKADNARRNFGKQGNSLFGEVCCNGNGFFQHWTEW